MFLLILICECVCIYDSDQKNHNKTKQQNDDCKNQESGQGATGSSMMDIPFLLEVGTPARTYPSHRNSEAI